VEHGATLGDDELQAVREIALTEPLLVNRLVSEKGHATAVNVTVQLPWINETTEVPEVVAFVRKLADEIRTNHHGINVYLTGMVMMNMTFTESAQHDLKTLIPLSFGLMFFLLALLVGGLMGTFASILVIGFSIIAAMGLGGYLGQPISPPSASAPTVILTVSIANCVHILVTFLHGLRHGLPKPQALTESLRVNVQPIFLACATTVLGFLSMNFSEAPPFNHLGNFVAMGVATSFLLSVTFLPAVLSLLPVRVKTIQDEEDTVMAKFGEFVVRRRNTLLWGMAAVIMVLITAIPRNELNDVFVHYFDESVTFRTDSDFTTENLTGLYNINYSLHAGESSGISKPEFLHEVDAFANWYRQQPETLHVNTITDILKRLNKNMHGDNEDMYRLPSQRDL
jgi:predicted RND superfamily exporter protein